MPHEELFRHVLVRLSQREAALRSDVQRSSARVRHCYELILQQAPAFVPADEARLEGYLRARPTAGDTSHTGGLIFLPAPSHCRRLAVVNVSYDFTCGNPILSLQLGFFVVGASTDPCLRAFGYRIETPERGPGPGPHNHDYHHAQPIAEIRAAAGGVRRLPQRPGWLPQDGPTFPLDAEDYVGLVVSLLMVVYGHREARTLAAEIARKRLDPWFASLRSPA